MSSHSADNPQHAHIISPRVYVMTLIALLILMLSTVWAAGQTFPGGTLVNNIIAMTIAVMKASLVVMIFMGVKYSTTLTKFWALLGFVWFFMLFIIFADYATRKYEPTPSWDKKDFGSSMPREMREPLGPPTDTNANAEPMETAPMHERNQVNVRPR